MKILVVDDEKSLVDAVAELLSKNKYVVDVAYNGEDGYDLASTGLYDLIVLDVMLPKKNGFQVVKELRDKNISTPVLMLSARTAVNDKVEGLEYGADDYLTKPFDTRELLARIKTLSKRKGEYTGSFLEYGDIKLNKDTHEIMRGLESISLGIKEFLIMETLMSNSSSIVLKDFLIEKIWGFDSDAEYNTIEVYISFIRKKLNSLGSFVNIKSSRGTGYKLEFNHDK